MTSGATQELHWLVVQGIEIADTYDLADARATLSNVFTYSDLKTFGGIDIDSIALRLQDAQRWFQQLYPNVDPFEWYPSIRSRSKVIRNHLSRIDHNPEWFQSHKEIFEKMTGRCHIRPRIPTPLEIREDFY